MGIYFQNSNKIPKSNLDLNSTIEKYCILERICTYTTHIVVNEIDAFANNPFTIMNVRDKSKIGDFGQLY